MITRAISHAPAKGSYLVLYVVVFIVKKEEMRSVCRLVQTRPSLTILNLYVDLYLVDPFSITAAKISYRKSLSLSELWSNI